MFGIENLFGKWLGLAKKIVIAGVRFNDYDHELMSTIAQYAHRKKYEIILINRAVDSEDQRLKIAKVAGLFSCSPSDISFVRVDEGKKTLPHQIDLKLSTVGN